MSSVVERGCGDPYWRVRWTAAQCGAIAPEWLAELANDTSVEVRCMAAGHELMPSDALQQLLDDRVSSVRVAAARHPSWSEADLCELAEHSDPAVRQVIARRCTTLATLERLAADPDLTVVDAVADNPMASARALHLITYRTTNPMALSVVARHHHTEVRDLLTNPEVTAETLALMPLDAPVAEHRAAAAHRHATFATCRRLAVHHLSSGHPGRRNIGVELVHRCVAKGDGYEPVMEGEVEPFDIVYALRTGSHDEALLAWATGSTGPKWPRRKVLADLGRGDE
jgi:hypothetical protein